MRKTLRREMSKLFLSDARAEFLHLDLRGQQISRFSD